MKYIKEKCNFIVGKLLHTCYRIITKCKKGTETN